MHACVPLHSFEYFNPLIGEQVACVHFHYEMNHEDKFMDKTCRSSHRECMLRSV